MSTLLRIFLMAVAWLVFTLVTFYGCVKPVCCGEEEIITEQVVPPPAIEDDYALVTELGAASVFTGALWPDLRDRLIGEYDANPNQQLDVYGYYYDSEPTPEGYDNMGLFRAAEIRDLLVAETNIPVDKIELAARLLETSRPDEGARWNAGEFSWQDLAEPGPEIIELENDEIVIRFPFDESTKQVSANVTDYLNKLAQRLQQTDETVTITGHTDDIDTDAYNQQLGQQRADFVRDILVRNGAPAGRITTRSRGEGQPERPNTSAANRALNRRAVVQLQQ